MKEKISLEKKYTSIVDSDECIKNALLNNKFKYLKIALEKEEYTATLVDGQDYEILRGYGKTKIEAINDLHSNLI